MTYSRNNPNIFYSSHSRRNGRKPDFIARKAVLDVARCNLSKPKPATKKRKEHNVTRNKVSGISDTVGIYKPVLFVFSIELSLSKKFRGEITSFHFRALLKQWLWADYMLYEHFKKLLRKRIIDFGIELIQRKIELLQV